MEHRAEELKRRTKEFALRVIRLIRALPKSPERGHLGPTTSLEHLNGRELSRRVPGQIAAGVLGEDQSGHRGG